MHHQYPEPGGLMDQDKALIEDMRTFGWYLNLARNKVKQDQAIADALKGKG